ncbi:MAG: tetratricopeptide repeat protein [Rhodocyclaceae bacterium]|nr:tetratricopeptide repeat protein [Rhodocyclaceae bacterium]
MNRLVRAVPVALIALALSVSVGAQPPSEDGAAAQPLEQPLTGKLLYEFLLAEVAGARGRLDIAVGAYLDMARQTRDARIARRATELALASRQLPAATEAAQIWSEVDPASPEAKRILAGLLMGSQGRLEEAQTQLARALAQAGDHLPQALLGLNRALAQVEDKGAARSAIDRLTTPYLSLPEARFARAHAAFAARDALACAGELDQALALRADWEPAVLLKAQVLQLSESGAAITLLKEYLSRHPESTAGRQAYGRLLAGGQRYSEALEQFEQALATDPDDVDLLYGAGVLAQQVGRLEEAERYLRKVLERKPADLDVVRLQLGRLAEQRKRLDEALTWYQAVEGQPRRDEARLRMAQALAEAGRIDEARRHLQAQPGEGVDRARWRLAEAQLLRDAQRLDEAAAVVEAALRQFPDNPDLLYESAMLAERRGQHQVMEGRLRKLIALQPDHSHAYNALGYSLVERGLRLDEAEQLIRKALELAPEDPFIVDSMGWVRFRRGDVSGAIVYLERAYGLRPDPEIAAHLGEVYWKLGRTEEARRLWADALRNNPANGPLQDAIRRHPQ